MKPLTSFALPLAAAFLSLPVAAQPTPKEAPPANSTVAGRVTVDGKPGRGVAVSLVPQGVPRQDRTEPGEKVRADGDGNFRFTGVAAGRYLLQPLAPTHVLDTAGDYGMPGKQISVEEGSRSRTLTSRSGAAVSSPGA